MDSIAWQTYIWEHTWSIFMEGENRLTLYIRHGSVFFETGVPVGTDPTYLIHFHRDVVFPSIPASHRKLLADRINNRIQRGDLYKLPPKKQELLPLWESPDE